MAAAEGRFAFFGMTGTAVPGNRQIFATFYQVSLICRLRLAQRQQQKARWQKSF